MNLLLKIDLTKIDKQRLFKSGQTGSIYLDAIDIETTNNQYGNSHMIVQSVSKEEREKGIQGNILGNAKTVEVQAPVSAPISEEDDLPF